MQVELHAAMRNLATCNAMRARRDHAIHARRNHQEKTANIFIP
jgi:hypothetical protein